LFSVTNKYWPVCRTYTKLGFIGFSLIFFDISNPIKCLQWNLHRMMLQYIERIKAHLPLDVDRRTTNANKITYGSTRDWKGCNFTPGNWNFNIIRRQIMIRMRGAFNWRLLITTVNQGAMSFLLKVRLGGSGCGDFLTQGYLSVVRVQATYKTNSCVRGIFLFRIFKITW
jgi:hypothetical protein